MKNFKKTHKGMTLYEMIISIAIFAIMCGVLVGVGMHIDSTNRAANNLKKKIAAEAPYAANKLTKDGSTEYFEDKDVTDLQMTISFVGNDLTKTTPESKTFYYYNKTTNKKESVTKDATCTIDLKKYSTERIYTGKDDLMSAEDKVKTQNGQLNLEFLEIQP